MQAFTYDLNGNRTQATRGSTTTNYTIAASSNRMVADPQPVTISAAGRLAANSRFTGVTHDGNGRLDSVQSVQGNYAFHYHNGLGERTYSVVASSTSPGVVTLSMYDLSGQLAVRYREATAQVPAGIVEEIVWLGSMPVASIRGGSVFYIHADHLNSPRRVTNTLNQPVWRWEQFDAFGDNVADENPSGFGVFEFVLRFPGQQFQAGWGVTYNYFRDYDSATGRYIQTDPIGLAGGINLYGYAEANPLSNVDPDGLQVVTPPARQFPSPLNPPLPKGAYQFPGEWRQDWRRIWEEGKYQRICVARSCPVGQASQCTAENPAGFPVRWSEGPFVSLPNRGDLRSCECLAYDWHWSTGLPSTPLPRTRTGF